MKCVYIPILVLFILFISLLQQNTGVADNGDFTRSVGWLIEKPVGFEVNWPERDTDEHYYRFFNYWHDEWRYKEPSEDSPPVISSYQVVFLAGYAVNKLLGGENYSIVFAGMLTKTIISIVVILTSRSLFGRRWPLWSAGILFVLHDSRYISYFNSFYQEQSAILFLFFLIFALARMESARQINAFFIVCSLFLLATAKLQLIFTPLIFVIAMILFPFQVRNRKFLLTSALIVQIIACTMIFYNKYSHVNAYHSFFNGALMFSNQSFPEYLSQEWSRCIGIDAWSQESNCFELISNEISFVDPILFYTKNPRSLLLGIDYTIQKLNILELGKFYSLEPRTGSTFAFLPIFNTWSRLKNLFTGKSVYFEIIFIASILYISRKEFPKLSFICAFLIMLAVSQVFISFLGEGIVDIKKHLLLGNLALDYSFILSMYLVVHWCLFKTQLLNFTDCRMRLFGRT